MKRYILIIISIFIFGYANAVNFLHSEAIQEPLFQDDTTKVNFYEMQQLKLYPNPATEFLYIDYDILFVKEASLKIFNSIGSVVYTKKLDSKKDNLKISVSDFDNGLYFCSLQIDGKLLNTKKILINHR